MACRVEVVCGHTSFGQWVAVVGAREELGCWEPARAVRLETSPETFPVWAGDVPPCIVGAEFKFVLLGFDEVEWERIPNRCWSLAQAAAAAEGRAVLATVFNDAEVRLRLLPTEFAPPRRGAASSSSKGPDSQPARPSRYTFKPTVSCFEVPDLREINDEAKKAIWWRPADFQEFLEARMAIVRAYQQHVREGTMSSFRDDLISRNESRRGLGLGRQKVRLNNTRAYIDAVVKEQRNQRLSGRPDVERLAGAARAVSAADLAYSMCNAASDAEVARAYCEEATVTNGGGHESPSKSLARVPTLARIKKVDSFGLFQTEEDEEPSPRLAADAKGFGLSAEELLQNGLRATGRRDASLQQEGLEPPPPPA